MPGGYRKVPHEREYIEQAKKDADTILALKSKIGKLAEVRNPVGKRTLKECEAVIETGVNAHIEAWLALKEIHDRTLFRPAYESFNDYCRARWGYTREGYRYVAAANVYTVLTRGSDKLSPPPSSAHAQQLAPLLDEPEKLKEAWSLALELNDGHPTFLEVRDIVAGYLPKKPSPSEPTQPTPSLESPNPSSLSGSPSFSETSLESVDIDATWPSGLSPNGMRPLGPTSRASGEAPQSAGASFPETYWTLDDVMKYQGRINSAIREAAKHASEPSVRIWLVSIYQFMKALMEQENLL